VCDAAREPQPGSDDCDRLVMAFGVELRLQPPDGLHRSRQRGTAIGVAWVHDSCLLVFVTRRDHSSSGTGAATASRSESALESARGVPYVHSRVGESSMPKADSRRFRSSTLIS